MVSFLYRFLEDPFALVWFIPLLVLLLLFFMFDRRKPQGEDYQKRRNAKKWFFISRALIFLFLLLFLALPYFIDRDFGKGDTTLTFLIDNSTSYTLFDQDQVQAIEERLQSSTDVRLVYFGDHEKTPLGDTIAEQLREGGNLLLVSDGYNNYGSALSDVLLQAVTSNSTVHALALSPAIFDSAVILSGPDKVSPGVKNAFSVQLTSTEKNKEHHVVVSVDGKQILDTTTVESSLHFTQTFSEGTHEITAQLIATDHFAENNVYYKSVRVIERPSILFYSKNPSPLLPLLQQLYAVTFVSELTAADKNIYYALVVNDISASELQEKLPILNEYLSDDNGILVIGGEQSFDRGGYKENIVEDMLPIQTGVAEEKDEGIVNIVIAIDISKSVGTAYGQGSVGDVQKAIAISALQNLKETHNVGVIAFSDKSYVVQPLTPVKGNRDAIIDKIASLVNTGSTYIPLGLAQAILMVEKAGGAKNVLLISDGASGGIGEARALAADAKTKGILVHGVGVGDPCLKYDPKKPEVCIKWSNEQYGVNAIQSIALTSGGTYFHGDETPQQVRLLFGDPNAGESLDSFSLLVKDPAHFITQDLRFTKKITGFNNVLPKKAANLLITAETGEPLLTVWRYGVGRVATITTDDGSIWAGQLLSGEDSLFFTKTLNWLIGDPEKKSKQFVYIPDTNLGRSSEILVKNMQEPTAEGLQFYKKSGDLYSATFMPTITGFHQLLGTSFAVNYNKELEGVGISNQLQTITSATGGILYTPETIGAILDRLTTPEKRPEETKYHYGWIFLLAALLTYLVEITLRRVREHKSI